MPNPNPKTDHLQATQFKPASDRAKNHKPTSLRLYVDQVEALAAIDGTLSDWIRIAVDEKLARQ